MHKRIQIVLSDATLRILDRVTTKGNRSRFIDRAIWNLAEVEGNANVRHRLEEGAIANADRDLAIATEWSPLEEEAAKLAETSRSRIPTRKRS